MKTRRTHKGAKEAAFGPRWARGDMVAAGIIAALAALLLFWHLDEKYLWQDEAATAVLSARMLKFGRPLAYDGVNLITNDNFAAEDRASLERRTGNPAAALDYYVKRGDFKPDTSWKYQPWGQFIITAASFKLLGQTTFAARFPFALAAMATGVLLFIFVRRYFNDLTMAMMAGLLLLLNGYWILHSRQCRYYALSSLLLLITFISYARWQRGRARWGAAGFLIAAWCWFQVDYGMVWPVLGVLFLDAVLARPTRDLWRLFVTGLVLAASIAPFAYYYELSGRFSSQIASWSDRFQGNLYNMNEYVVPILIVIACVVLLMRHRRKLALLEGRIVAIGCGIVIGFALWVPTVAPDSFLRYVMPVMPAGALITAWVLVRGVDLRNRAFAWAGAAVVALTPWAPAVFRLLAPAPEWAQPASLALRPELPILISEVFGNRPDPNRIIVEWLKKNASPSDEILVNYEDVPLMFYLPNPIRGGISAFRVEDDSKAPPRFMVMRRSVAFVHWAVFQREADRYQWTIEPLQAPDIIWGNNPDPMGQAQDPARASPLLVARRIE